MSVLVGDGFIGIDIKGSEEIVSPFGWGGVLAHLHQIVGGPYDKKWFWIVTSIGSCRESTGIADTHDEARAACQQCILNFE